MFTPCFPAVSKISTLYLLTHILTEPEIKISIIHIIVIEEITSLIKRSQDNWILVVYTLLQKIGTLTIFLLPE